MLNRTYKLTEEIARQTVEVLFNLKNEEWFICFSNPTAGPWKLVKLWNPDKPDMPDIVGSFLKEEARPDLVLFSYKHKVFILLEAKKRVSELLNSTQMKKTIGVFRSEIDKFKKIPRISLEIESGINYRFIPGFLYPSTTPTGDLETLHEAFTHILSKQANGDITDYITFIISPSEGNALKSFWHIDSTGNQESNLRTLLEQSFPTGVTKHIDSD